MWLRTQFSCPGQCVLRIKSQQYFMPGVDISLLQASEAKLSVSCGVCVSWSESLNLSLLFRHVAWDKCVQVI